MIVLLLLMASIIVIPMTVEAVRSPDDNLAEDARKEFVETVLRPLGNKLEQVKISAATAIGKAIRTALLVRLLSRLLAFLKNLLKAVLTFLDK